MGLPAYSEAERQTSFGVQPLSVEALGKMNVARRVYSHLEASNASALL